MSDHQMPRMYCSLLAYCTARFGRSNFSLLDAPAPTDAFHTLAAEVGTMSGNRSINFAEMPTSTVHFRDLLHAANVATWDPRLYFPSEGRRAEDFSALKNPTASAGFEPCYLHMFSYNLFDTAIKSTHRILRHFHKIWLKVTHC
jgi:hypothetical protein